jgi:hypothetical protein
MRISKRWVFCALVGVLAGLAACRQAPDEVRVREAIAASAEAAEAADAGGVVEPLSDDFDGNGGRLERKNFANLVRLARLRGERIGVTVGPIAVERRGERLLARFTVSLTQGTRLLPDAAGVYQAETAWRLEGDDWRCYSATWERKL